MTTEVEAQPETEEQPISISVTTLTGSITGKTMRLEVDSSLSIHQLKLLVQEKAHAAPEIECGPKRKSTKQVTTDFQRVFFGDNELVDDKRTLQHYGVERGSGLFFAVGKTVGNKLRGAMHRLDDSFSYRNDCDILGSVLRDLKARFRRGGRGSTELTDELFGVFDPKFENLRGVHDGYLTLAKKEGGKGDYIQWVVDEDVEGSFQFKTYYGIPAYTRLHRRKNQRLTDEPVP